MDELESARTHSEWGDHEEALDLAEQALDSETLSPEDTAEANFLAAESALILGKHLKALRLYRKVLAEPAIEQQPLPALEECLRGQLLSAIQARGGDAERIPANVNVSHLTDLLILRMPVDPPMIQELFGELDVEQRAMRSLKLHDQLPELPPDAEGGSQG